MNENFFKIFSGYFMIFDNVYKSQLKELKIAIKYFKSEYLLQDGYNFFSNVSLKIKPFIYKRRI